VLTTKGSEIGDGEMATPGKWLDCEGQGFFKDAAAGVVPVGNGDAEGHPCADCGTGETDDAIETVP